MAADKKLTIIEDPDRVIPTEVMAQAVVDISAAAKKLLAGPLTERAVLVLIHDATGVPLRTIREVLVGASNLAALYVRKGA